ncbi:hypothetical protein B9T16_20315 [Arthrospira sp. PCC 8006]
MHPPLHWARYSRSKLGENAIAPQKTAPGKGRVYITGWCVRWLTAAPAPTLGVLFNVEIG